MKNNNNKNNTNTTKTSNVEKVISHVGTKDIEVSNSFIFYLFVIVVFIVSGAFLWLPILYAMAWTIHKITGKKQINIKILNITFPAPSADE